jgi:hypothetical protein
MTPIICRNDLRSVIDRLQDYLIKSGTIKGVRLVDQSDEQAVLLVDNKPIDQDKAVAWWEGFRAALEINENDT